jgi:hypothetical protein
MVHSEFRNELPGNVIKKSPREESLLEDNIESREVVLTEFGIDIYNYFDIGSAKPFDKPKIGSPQNRAVHIPTLRNSQRQCFPETLRYGSRLNTLASALPVDTERANLECKIMAQQGMVIIKNSQITEYREIPSKIETANFWRGTSFRGRGNLDIRMGWCTVGEIEEGEITSNNPNIEAVAAINFDLNLPEPSNLTKLFSTKEPTLMDALNSAVNSLDSVAKKRADSKKAKEASTNADSNKVASTNTPLILTSHFIVGRKDEVKSTLESIPKKVLSELIVNNHDYIEDTEANHADSIKANESDYRKLGSSTANSNSIKLVSKNSPVISSTFIVERDNIEYSIVETTTEKVVSELIV